MCMCSASHSFSFSSRRTGNSNNNHKTYFIFSVWAETTGFPLVDTLSQLAQSAPIRSHTHTFIHMCTHTSGVALSCAVLRAVRVITWSVVCLVTFSLYELRAFTGPSVLSIDLVCVWFLSLYQPLGSEILSEPNYLISAAGRGVYVWVSVCGWLLLLKLPLQVKHELPRGRSISV